MYGPDDISQETSYRIWLDAWLMTDKAERWVINMLADQAKGVHNGRIKRGEEFYDFCRADYKHELINRAVMSAKSDEFIEKGHEWFQSGGPGMIYKQVKKQVTSWIHRGEFGHAAKEEMNYVALMEHDISTAGMSIGYVVLKQWADENPDVIERLQNHDKKKIADRVFHSKYYARAKGMLDMMVNCAVNEEHLKFASKANAENPQLTIADGMGRAHWRLISDPDGEPATFDKYRVESDRKEPKLYTGMFGSVNGYVNSNQETGGNARCWVPTSNKNHDSIEGGVEKAAPPIELAAELKTVPSGLGVELDRLMAEQLADAEWTYEDTDYAWEREMEQAGLTWGKVKLQGFGE